MVGERILAKEHGEYQSGDKQLRGVSVSPCFLLDADRYRHRYRSVPSLVLIGTHRILVLIGTQKQDMVPIGTENSSTQCARHPIKWNITFIDTSVAGVPST